MMATVSSDARESTAFEHATVQAVIDGGLIVHGAHGVASARTAVSCLVQPEPGDRVLLTRTADECFVLAVLARESSARRLHVDGSLTVSARELVLEGEQRARLGCAERLDLHGEHVDVASRALEVHSQRVQLAGEQVHAHYRRARLIAGVLETFGERIVQSARTVTRRVEETETLHIGTLIQRIREHWLARSKRVSITASSDVHVDGERIHMG